MMTQAQLPLKPLKPLKPKNWNRGWLDAAVIAVLFAVIGLWYAGSDFITSFDTALPSAPAGGGTGEMIPGDQFEQFYRHALPHYNGMRGLPLYYSGYQYALGQQEPFYEGWIFLPFSLLTSALAFLIGPIAAYNLVGLLSFSLCGVFGYLLGREVGGGHRLSGYCAAALIALLPFRVSFLFGEMIYATDVAFLPLILFAFVRFVTTPTWQWSGLFFFGAFLLSGANFALFYWFILFFGPMFVIGALMVAKAFGADLKKWGLLMASSIPFLLLIGWNLWTVSTILSGSALSSGQGLDEVRHFSPSVRHMFTRWSGNETSIYLGLGGILAVLGMVVVVSQKTWKIGTEGLGTRLIALYAVLIFPVTYLFSLGLTFDDATGIGFYTFFFENVPGVSSSRTPGRIMPVVAVAAAVLAATSCAWASRRIPNVQVRIAVGVLLVYFIAWDFRFSDVRMSTVVGPNQAYLAAVSEGEGNIVAIPFEREADHYLNATYQYFAIINGARLANGHSSMFPKEWDVFAGRFYVTLNKGIAPREDLQELKRRGFGYIAVHNTPYAPSARAIVTALLERNPALQKISTDQGVVMFRIGDPSLAAAAIPFQDVIAASQASAADSTAETQDEVEYVMGWYAREAYPDQPAFRWMAGVESAIVLPAPPVETGDDHVFRYKCPSGDLQIAGEGIATRREATQADGWTTVYVDTSPGQSAVLTLEAAEVYRVPTDTREFGCMIQDIEPSK